MIVQRKVCEVDIIPSGFPSDKGDASIEKIKHNLFDELSRMTSFPEVQRRCSAFGCAGPVIIILDGYTPHPSNWFLDEALEVNVGLDFLVPPSFRQHSTLPPRNLRSHSEWLHQSETHPTDSNPWNQLLCMLCAWFSVAMPKNLIGSFSRTGIVPCWHTEREKLMTSAIKARVALAKQPCLEHSDEQETTLAKESDGDLEVSSHEEGW
jgi:hypothetical protein